MEARCFPHIFSATSTMVYQKEIVMTPLANLSWVALNNTDLVSLLLCVRPFLLRPLTLWLYFLRFIKNVAPNKKSKRKKIKKLERKEESRKSKLQLEEMVKDQKQNLSLKNNKQKLRTKKNNRKLKVNIKMLQRLKMILRLKQKKVEEVRLLAMLQKLFQHYLRKNNNLINK